MWREFGIHRLQLHSEIILRVSPKWSSMICDEPITSYQTYINPGTRITILYQPGVHKGNWSPVDIRRRLN